MDSSILEAMKPEAEEKGTNAFQKELQAEMSAAKPSPITLAREISHNVVMALTHPDQTSYLDALHKNAEFLAPSASIRFGQSFDANAPYRATVRELLANVFSSAGGNGPEIGISKYGFITCTEPWVPVKSYGRQMFQARRVIADPQNETKVLDLGKPWDGKVKKEYHGTK